jgi:hypothetical protein
MSESRVAALVCEGQTDVPILREIIQELWPNTEVRSLQPALDSVGRSTSAAGWGQVRSWCEQHAGHLEDVLDPDLGDPIDLLVVAVDIDIAIEAGITDPPNDIGNYETTRMRTTIGEWLKTPTRQKLPSAIVVSTPVMALEAWIIAALFPRQSSPDQIINPAQWLVQRQKLRSSPTDGSPWKELHRYREFAPKVAAKIRKVRGRCAEAERTCTLIEQRKRTIGKR